MSQSFLKPKVSDPLKLRKKQNGQFNNPPVYMELGGFGSSSGLKRSSESNLSLERGGPSAKRGKPI